MLLRLINVLIAASNNCRMIINTKEKCQKEDNRIFRGICAPNLKTEINYKNAI
jgi:hypothetical protein